MPQQANNQNNHNANNSEEKKRSDENVSQLTATQIQNAKLAIQQSKMAQLYMKQARNIATQTDVNIAYAPITMEEITAFIAAQQAIPTPNQNAQAQSQNQWTQQLAQNTANSQPQPQPQQQSTRLI